MTQSHNVMVAAGLVAFAAAGLAFPLSSRNGPVIDSSKPLPPQATFRGPYMNAGSRDIGPDHQTYPKKSVYHIKYRFRLLDQEIYSLLPQLNEQ